MRNLRTVSAFCLIFVLFTHSSTLAQTDSTQISIQDSIRYDYIFLSGKYQNKFTFYGRDFGQKIPIFSTELMYVHHTNLWAGLSGYSFFNAGIPFQTGLSLGYYKNITPKTDISLSYSQFLMKNINLNGMQSQGFFQATFGLDWKYLYSTLQTVVLVSDTSDIFFTFQSSRYFQFNELLLNTFQVSFEPKASLSAGTTRFDYTSADVLAGPGGGASAGAGRGRGKPGATSGSKFEFLNWEILFPLSFEARFFTIEGNIRYTHPLNVKSFDPSKPTFVFGAELTFNLPIKKKVKRKMTNTP